jgi:hypothetical protein
MWKIEIGCTSYEFIPGFEVRFTRSLVLCVCFEVTKWIFFSPTHEVIKLKTIAMVTMTQVKDRWAQI